MEALAAFAALGPSGDSEFANRNTLRKLTGGDGASGPGLLGPSPVAVGWGWADVVCCKLWMKFSREPSNPSFPRACMFGRAGPVVPES